MLNSMTGLGRAVFTNNEVNLEIVVKSVNQRGLEIKYRFPEELSFLENHAGPAVSELLHRGRIEIFAELNFLNKQQEDFLIDEKKAESLIKQAAKLNDRFLEVLPISMGDILAVPGILTESDRSFVDEKFASNAIKTVREALLDLVDARAREGKALAVALKDLYRESVELINDIASVQKSDVEKRFLRFKARMDELFKTYNLNEDRLYQEFAMLAERSDYQEEIDRLKAHAEYFSMLCESDEIKGRKLDFLCQEMLRESNTLMSKAFDSAVTIKAIELKACIERIREQVQNIE